MSRRLLVLLTCIAVTLPGLSGGPAVAQTPVQTKVCAATAAQDPMEGGQLDVRSLSAALECDDNEIRFSFATHDEWDAADFNDLFVRIDTDGDVTNGCNEGDYLAYAVNRDTKPLGGLFASPDCDEVTPIGLGEVTVLPTGINITVDRGLMDDPDRIGYFGLLADQAEQTADADRVPDAGRAVLEMGPLDDPASVGVCVEDPADDVLIRDEQTETAAERPAVDLTEACAYYGTGLRFDIRLPVMDFPGLGAGSGPVVLIDLDGDGSGDRLLRAIWNGSAFTAAVTDTGGNQVCTGQVRAIGEVFSIGNMTPSCVDNASTFGFSMAMGARTADGAAYVDRAGPAEFTPMRRAAPVDETVRGTDPSTLDVPDPAARPADRGLVRLAGPARIETSVVASADAWPDGAAAAVLARQDVEADALAAAALATAINAPLLLTPSEGLTNIVATELRRLLPDGARVYAVGGSAALSDRVLGDVQQLGLGVVRLSGASRVETGLEIAREAARFLPTVDHILIADAFEFQWALMAGPAAGARSGVVITTAGSGLSPAARAFIADHPDAVVTAVGPGASTAAPDARSITGADAYETSVLVAQTFFPGVTRAAVASGENFPDGLAGGAFSGSVEMPLLLSTQAELSQPVAEHLSAGTYTELIMFGGDAALSQAVEASLRQNLG